MKVGESLNLYKGLKNFYLMKKIYIPTFGEEVGNTISHGVMSILMLLAMPFAALFVR